jgi:hypothetical protein
MIISRAKSAANRSVQWQAANRYYRKYTRCDKIPGRKNRTLRNRSGRRGICSQNSGDQQGTEEEMIATGAAGRSRTWGWGLAHQWSDLTLRSGEERDWLWIALVSFYLRGFYTRGCVRLGGPCPFPALLTPPTVHQPCSVSISLNQFAKWNKSFLQGVMRRKGARQI